MNDFVGTLEEHVLLPELDIPQASNVDLSNLDEIEEAAETVRSAWGLGVGPLPHVVRELERHGIMVARVSTSKHEVDAFSVKFPGRPIVILGVDKAVTARSRFDAAHELAHLVLHSDLHAAQRWRKPRRTSSLPRS